MNDYNEFADFRMKDDSVFGKRQNWNEYGYFDYEEFGKGVSCHKCEICGHPFLVPRMSRTHRCYECYVDEISGIQLRFSDAGFKIGKREAKKIWKTRICDLKNNVYIKESLRKYKQEESARIRQQLTDELKKKIIKIYDSKCAVCGYNKCSNDIHHIRPVAEGGPSTLKNLILLCPNCHKEAHSGILPRKKLRAIAREYVRRYERE